MSDTKKDILEELKKYTEVLSQKEIDELVDMLLGIKRKFESDHTGQLTDEELGMLLSAISDEEYEAPEMPPEMVEHPDHYAQGREYEPYKVIYDWGLDFNLGNAVKYISRAGRKNDIIEDLRKAKQYIDFEIELIEKEREHI